MVAPEEVVLHQLGLGVLGGRRQIGQHARQDFRDGVGVGRAIGNVLGLVRHVRRVAGEGDELVRVVQVLGALRDHPEIVVRHLAVPNDLEVLAVRLGRVINAAVPGGGHHDLPARQQLCRLRPGFPPDDLAFDGVELLERPVHPGRRLQHVIHLLARHAVRHQRELQVHERTFLQAALARELLQVEQVGQRRGARLQLVRVVGHDRRVNDGADGAVGRRALHEFLLVADLRPVELQEQAVLAALQRGLGIDVDHVPGHVAALDHGADLGDLAVVFLGGDLAAVLLLERPEVRLVLAALVCAAPGHDVEAGRPRRAAGGQDQARGGQGAQARRSAQHRCGPPMWFVPTPPHASSARQSFQCQPTVTAAPTARSPWACPAGTLTMKPSRPPSASRTRRWSPR